MKEIKGKSILVLVSPRFKFARARVFGSQVYLHGLHGPWKVLENWNIVGYPWKLLEFSFQWSPWIFFKSPWIKITFVKNVLRKVNDWKHSNTQIFLVIMKVFSYDFNVPGIVHFLLFEVPKEPCLNEERCCNKWTLLHWRILKVFTSCYWGKEVLEKMIVRSLKSPWFFPRNSLWNMKKFYE